MKTVELTGQLLDFFVAKAEDLPRPTLRTRSGRAPSEGDEAYCVYGDEKTSFSPTTDNSAGDAIIARENIYIEELSTALFSATKDSQHPMIGATRLEAGMRCHVASKYGAELKAADVYK